MEFPFQIGDKVTNTKIGLPMVGRVDGLVFPAKAIMGYGLRDNSIGLDGVWATPYPNCWEGWAVKIAVLESQEVIKKHNDKYGLPKDDESCFKLLWFPAADLKKFDPDNEVEGS